LPQSLPLYSKVCLINGAVFVAATSLQVVSPATVSNRVTGGELAVLAIGLAVILATNAALVYSSLPSVDQLIQRLGKFDTDAPPEKRGGSHGLGLCVVADASNDVDAVALARTEDIDLVILDVGGVFPRPSGALQIWRGVALPPSSGAACGGSRIYTQRWKTTIGMRMGSPSEADQALRVRGSKPRWAVSFDACCGQARCHAAAAGALSLGALRNHSHISGDS
jgi:hypothetical protein